MKYLNNIVEAHHDRLKQLIRTVRGLKTLKATCPTIEDSEVMRALHQDQAAVFSIQGGIVGEARTVERAFGVGGWRHLGYTMAYGGRPGPDRPCPDPLAGPRDNRKVRAADLSQRGPRCSQLDAEPQFQGNSSRMRAWG